jgi:hypothetical protein
MVFVAPLVSCGLLSTFLADLKGQMAQLPHASLVRLDWHHPLMSPSPRKWASLLARKPGLGVFTVFLDPLPMSNDIHVGVEVSRVSAKVSRQLLPT